MKSIGCWKLGVPIATLLCVALTGVASMAKAAGAPYYLFKPLSRAQKQSIAEAFKAHNPGLDWDTNLDDPLLTHGAAVNDYSGFMEKVTCKDPICGYVSFPPSKNDFEVAKKFLIHNKDFFGLTDELIEQCRFQYWPGITGGTIRVESPRVFYPGYEKVGYSAYVSMEMEVRKEMVVRATNFFGYRFRGQDARLPKFPPLDLSPSIASDSPKLTSQMLGKTVGWVEGIVLPTGEGATVKHNYGVITHTDIPTPELRIYSFKFEDGTLWVGPVWAFERIKNFASFLFTAHSGRLVKEAGILEAP